MNALEHNQVGILLTTKVEFPPEWNASVVISATPDCEILASNTYFKQLFQDFLNNSAEKNNEHPVEIHADIRYDSKTDMFHLHIEDDVQYEHDTVADIVATLNTSRMKHSAKKGRKELNTAEIEYLWMFVTSTRKIMEAWGGSLVYSESEDHRVITDVSWTKNGMLNIRPPQLHPEDVF